MYRQRKKHIILLESKNRLIESQKEDIEIKKEQLMEINLAKDKVFGIISHDLRNAIKGLVVGAEELQHIQIYDEVQKIKTVRFIDFSAKQTNKLLESLLEYANQRFQQKELKLEEIFLSELIDKAIDLYSSEIKSKNLTITKDVFHPTAKANEDYTRLIIRNILHNAIKFSQIGGTININISKEDDFTILKITDHGIGMSIKEIDKVNNYLPPEIQTPIGNISKGTGFGLITAKESIEKLDGELYIDSSENTGTTIHLYFLSN